MSDLKTLNEIYLDCADCVDGVAGTNQEEAREQLKKEAIKWCKWLDKNQDIKQVYEEETRSLREVYSLILDPQKLKETEMKMAREIVFKRPAISGWIKYFFNIKEEELK